MTINYEDPKSFIVPLKNSDFQKFNGKEHDSNYPKFKRIIKIETTWDNIAY